MPKINLSNGAAQCAYVVVAQLKKPEPEDFFTSGSIAVLFKKAKILLPEKNETNPEYQSRLMAWNDTEVEYDILDSELIYLTKAFQDLYRDKKLDGNEYFAELGKVLSLDKK